MSWQSLIKRRVLIVGDMNAHSTMWNPHCHKRQNAGPLETLIETYELLVNNDPDYATRLSSGGISIIDLALTSPQLGPLRVWEIPEEYPSLSDHELILVEWEEMEEEKSRSQQGSSTGWNIQKPLDDEQLFSTARTAWIEEGIGRPYLSIESSMQDLDDEVEWFEAKLSQLLDRHAKITRVGAYSKRWWNKEVAEARKVWAQDKKKYGRNISFKEELRQARNAYYHTIRKAKRECWQNFLQGADDDSQPKAQSMDKNHCWTALQAPTI